MSRARDQRDSCDRPTHRRRKIVAALSALTLGWAAFSPSVATAGAPGGASRSSSAVQTAVGSRGVFAIDRDHHTVIFAPANGGPVRPVMAGLTNPTDIKVSRGGSLLIVDGPRLLKITPHGVIQTIRSGMAANSTIAVDDNNWLFVHDGLRVVKYSPRDGSAPITVGSGTGLMTLDGAGNISLTTPDPDDYERTAITTFPVKGGPATIRRLTSVGNTGLEYGYLAKALEARDGTLYIEINTPGGSGASSIAKLEPGPPGAAPAVEVDERYTEYVYTVDSASNFFLLQNRAWCTAPSRDEGDCVDDYAVDAVQKFASAGSTPTTVPVNGLQLPVGGITVAATGVIYAAVDLSRNALPSNSVAVPSLVKISASGGSPVVLATGHFRAPVAEDFLWYVA